ncbi:hypothetical protein EG329_001929 [Mollisiaceae sp. DMI_Dod_QoI]|nr:hypothetical protein EG329_001929 [Helotiales sp. DMI_Dod_QoI]
MSQSTALITNAAAPSEPVTGEDPGPVLIGDYFKMIHENLLALIVRDSYLNGLFKDIITKDTHIVDIYTSLINSASVPSNIKPALIAARREFIDVRARYPTTNNSAQALMLACSAHFHEIIDHMEDDARSRGLWVPKDNTDDAEGTFITDNQGNAVQFLSSAEDYPKDAPVEFRERRAAYIKMRSENPVSDERVAYRPEDEKLLVEKVKESDTSGRAEFGKAFGKNLRRAFE